MSTPGYARPEETLGRLQKFGAKLQPVLLGRTGLSVSPYGFGGYRVAEFDSDHRDALRLAIKSGINLIDTSTNYTDGSSERLFGEILTELFAAGEIEREEIVIISKVGYVQGNNLKEAREQKASGQGFPEMVEFEKDCWHNISPAYLEDQITRSLNRLKLDTLDGILLHNPEYFLKTVQNRPQYEDRIKRAFAYLETEVERKRIRFYGISSNTFPEPDNNREFTSLDRVWGFANEIKKSHHFSVIQFPMNVFETGAAITPNNGGQSVLARAKAYNLGTLINRPFNAYHRGRLVRLTSFPVHDQVDVKGRLHLALGKVVEIERRLPDQKLKSGFAWGQLLRDRLSDLSDLLTWREFVRQQILPQLHQSLSRLSNPDKAWGTEYQTALHELLTLITSLLEGLANERADILTSQMTAFAPTLAGADTLSRKTLQIYRSLPGVSTILIGMRQPSYVEDILRAQIKPIAEDQAMKVMREMPKLP